jgi:transcription elongation factor Elf1
MDYDELPSRGKVTAFGEKTKNHKCSGKCYVFYDEDRNYHVECEHCGTVASYKTNSLDSAIEIWNDMTDKHEFE